MHLFKLDEKKLLKQKFEAGLLKMLADKGLKQEPADKASKKMNTTDNRSEITQKLGQAAGSMIQYEDSINNQTVTELGGQNVLDNGIQNNDPLPKGNETQQNSLMITNLDSFGGNTLTDKLNLNTIQTDKLKTLPAGVNNQDFSSIAKQQLSSKNATKTNNIQKEEPNKEKTKSNKSKEKPKLDDDNITNKLDQIIQNEEANEKLQKTLNQMKQRTQELSNALALSLKNNDKVQRQLKL